MKPTSWPQFENSSKGFLKLGLFMIQFSISLVMACIGDRTTACTLIIITLCALYYTWFGFEIKKYFKCLSLDIKR